MPWCGIWGTAVSPIWWVLPLIGLLFMTVMVLVCFRRFGFRCMGQRWRDDDALSGLRSEVERLKKEVRSLQRQPD